VVIEQPEPGVHLTGGGPNPEFATTALRFGTSRSPTEGVDHRVRHGKPGPGTREFKARKRTRGLRKGRTTARSGYGTTRRTGPGPHPQWCTTGSHRARMGGPDAVTDTAPYEVAIDPTLLVAAGSNCSTAGVVAPSTSQGGRRARPALVTRRRLPNPAQSHHRLIAWREPGATGGALTQPGPRTGM